MGPVNAKSIQSQAEPAIRKNGRFIRRRACLGCADTSRRTVASSKPPRFTVFKLCFLLSLASEVK
jgi:hypothetical protein